MVTSLVALMTELTRRPVLENAEPLCWITNSKSLGLVGTFELIAARITSGKRSLNLLGDNTTAGRAFCRDRPVLSLSKYQ